MLSRIRLVQRCIDPPGTTTALGHRGVFSAIVDGDPLLYILLHGRFEGSVFGRQGAEEAELEVSHQVHDVVPEARRAKSYQRGVRTGLCLIYFNLVTEQNFSSLKRSSCVSFSGNLHIFRLREMGAEEEGGFYFRVQVLRGSRPQLNNENPRRQKKPASSQICHMCPKKSPICTLFLVPVL